MILNQLKSSLYLGQPGSCRCDSNICSYMVFWSNSTAFNFKIWILKFLVKFLVSSTFDIFPCKSYNICCAWTFRHVWNANANSRGKHMAYWTDFKSSFWYYCASNGENCNHIKHFIRLLSKISKNILNSFPLGAWSSSKRIDAWNETSEYCSVTTGDSRFARFKSCTTHWQAAARNVCICLETFYDTRCCRFFQWNC